MAKFRFHRGSLEESMKTVIDIDTKYELLDAYVKSYRGYKLPHPLDKIPLTISDLKFYHQGYDKRIDWESYLVSLCGCAIGHCNSSLEKMI